MDNKNRYLDDLHDALFGNGNEPECNYEDMTIGYNEDGEIYWWLDTNYWGKPICINMMVKIPEDDNFNKVSTRLGSIVGDDWYESLDYFIEHREQLEKEMFDKAEREIKKAMK